MGTELIDNWSLGHFLGGVLARLVIFPNNVGISFILSFIIHLGCELLEHRENPSTGKILETNKNKVSDMVMFLLGWTLIQLLYERIKVWRVYNNKIVYFVLLVIFVYGTVLEYLRELFPYNKWNGAFK